MEIKQILANERSLFDAARASARKRHKASEKMKQNDRIFRASLAHRQSYMKEKRQEELASKLMNENPQTSVQNKRVNEKIEVNQMDRFKIPKLSEKKQSNL